VTSSPLRYQNKVIKLFSIWAPPNQNFWLRQWLLPKRNTKYTSSNAGHLFILLIIHSGNFVLVNRLKLLYIENEVTRKNTEHKWQTGVKLSNLSDNFNLGDSSQNLGHLFLFIYLLLLLCYTIFKIKKF